MAGGGLLAAARNLERGLFRLAAVDRVVDLERPQPEVIACLELRDDLFDIGGLPVTAGAQEPHCRLLVRNDGNEVLVRQPDNLAFVHGRDEIVAFFLHLDAAGGFEPLGGHRNRTLVVHPQHAAGQRFVGLDFDFNLGAGHGPYVTEILLDQDFKTGPLRIVVGEANGLDVRHFDNLNLELFALNAARHDVVAERLAHAREKELETRIFHLALHGSLLPLHAAVELGEKPGRRRLETDHPRCHDQVGALANGRVSRLDNDLIQRRYGRLQPAAPEAGRAITPITRTGAAEPHQEPHGAHGSQGVAKDALRLDNLLDRRGFGNPHRVFGQ